MNFDRARDKKTGQFVGGSKLGFRKCLVGDCQNNFFAKGYCSLHFQRIKRHGDPLKEPIKLSAQERKQLRTQAKKKYKKTEKGLASNKKYLSGPSGYLAKYISTKTRRERLNISTPKWVNRKELLQFYKNTPDNMTVDHIHPVVGIIYGEHVSSGLNVVYNLQYLTKEENAIKGNSFDGTSDNNSWRIK
jgi:hypothetical protein